VEDVDFDSAIISAADDIHLKIKGKETYEF
jgi:hypothetical protein